MQTGAHLEFFLCGGVGCGGRVLTILRLHTIFIGFKNMCYKTHVINITVT